MLSSKNCAGFAQLSETTKAMKKILSLLLAAGLACSAFALDINPLSGTLNVTRWEGDQTSQAQIDATIAAFLGSATFQYKQDQGGGESGALAGSYNTVFLNTPTDPSGATITYTGGAVLADTRFLLVKDGNATPAWYLFNLTALGWNGTDTLNLANFWPNQGAISHVSLYGGGTSVPDSGTTVALLGASLLALGMLRRRFSAA